jgi:predicted nucleotidyltransferase
VRVTYELRVIYLTVASAVLLQPAVPHGQDPLITLIDVASQIGLDLLNVSGSPTKDYITDANGNGVAFFDYDNDSDMDVLLVNGSTVDRMAMGGDAMVALYENDGRGRFRNVTGGSGLDRRGWGTGVCIADVDNDGFQDVYVTAIGRNVLWRNTGGRRFQSTDEASDTRWSTGCAFGDYDRDGHVDLYVANYLRFDPATVPRRGETSCGRFMNIVAFCGPRALTPESDTLYRNAGDGRFIDVTAAAGVAQAGHYGFGVLFGDLDDDGWPDIYVANDSVPNLLFRNRRDGTFVEEGLMRGVAVSRDGREQAGMGVDAGDYNGDGRLDLVVTNFAQDYTTVYDNLGEGIFADRSFESGVATGYGPFLGWGVGFIDIDNDGLLDLFVSNGHVYPEIEKTRTSTYLQRNLLFLNQGKGRLAKVSASEGSGLALARSSRGAAFGDYDNDGDIDVLISNIDDRPTLLRNDTRGGRWITMRLVGVKSNRDGIGAKVAVVAGGRRQIAEVRAGGSYVSQNDVRLHFGLGNEVTVDEIEIRWPSGLVQRAGRLEANRFYEAREGSGIQEDPRLLR